VAVPWLSASVALWRNVIGSEVVGLLSGTSVDVTLVPREVKKPVRRKLSVTWRPTSKPETIVCAIEPVRAETIQSNCPNTFRRCVALLYPEMLTLLPEASTAPGNTFW
jgi:hypothetical protein